MNVGFIGLGNMGGGMAANIVKAGHAMVVHDVSDKAVAALVAQGATKVESPRAVAAQSEVVCTSLPGPKEIEGVALGEQGILAGIRHGSIYIDLSTSSVSLTRRLGAEFQKVGAQMLDAPVSGGPQGANAGTLALMVGGDEAAFQKAKPLLDAMGDKEKIYYAGALGAGTVCKLVHNCASFCATIAIGECLTMGIKAGVDPRALWETMRRGALGNMFDLHIGMPVTLFRGDFEPRFSLKLAHKDIGLAVQMAQELGVPARLALLSSQELQEAMNRGWGEKDCRIALTLQEERAGVKIRIPDIEL